MHKRLLRIAPGKFGQPHQIERLPQQKGTMRSRHMSLCQTYLGFSCVDQSFGQGFDRIGIARFEGQSCLSFGDGNALLVPTQGKPCAHDVGIGVWR